MSQTVINTAHFRQIWASDVFVEARERMFFMRTGLIGKGEDSVIQELTQLGKERGDRIHVHLRMKLTGSGVTGDGTLEGQEEQLVFYQDTVTIDQIGNAVRSPGSLETKKAAYDVRAHGRDALSVWLAETLDSIIMDHLAGNTSQTWPATALAASTNRVIYAGTATAENQLTNNPEHRLTVEEISRARWLAETSVPQVRPIMVDGEPHYVMLMHPNQAFHLHYSGTGTIARMWEQGQREAMERGRKNPLFTGALGLWDGVILRAHRQVPLFTAGSGSAQTCHAMLLGAQAGFIAFGSQPKWSEKSFNYDNEVGTAYRQILGIKKARFNSEDFGCVTVITAAADPAGTSHT